MVEKDNFYTHKKRDDDHTKERSLEDIAEAHAQQLANKKLLKNLRNPRNKSRDDIEPADNSQMQANPSNNHSKEAQTTNNHNSITIKQINIGCSKEKSTLRNSAARSKGTSSASKV